MIKIGKQMYTRCHWIAGIGLGVLLAFVVGALLPSHAHAYSSTANTYSSTNDFYAYVQTGENLDVSFVKQIDTNSAGDVDGVLTISRPGASDVTCTVLSTDVVSTACTFSNQTATSTGIWHVRWSKTGNADYYSWAITVQTGTTDIPGRLWGTAHNESQPAGTPSTGINLSMWYQSQLGYLYKADYSNYNGIESTLQANALGIIKSGGGCTPLYKSVNSADSAFAFPSAACSPAYKLFFEAPAADLPASATRWDSTTDWVKPAITVPGIANTSFTSTTTDSRDGNVTFDLTNYIGSVDLHVDTNNNGSYSDPADVTITQGVSSGSITIPFDGKDGNGATIPKSQAIRFKVSIARVAEIHFLMNDVELRGGGIAVQRLNGDPGGESTIFWDDTGLPSPDANRCSLTSVRDGTAGVDSTGGVHAWSLTGCGAGDGYGNMNDQIHGSWGDGRIINDWAYASSNASATYVLGAHTDPVEATLADTGQNTTTLLTAAALVTAVPALIFLAFKKRLLS